MLREMETPLCTVCKEPCLVGQTVMGGGGKAKAKAAAAAASDDEDSAAEGGGAGAAAAAAAGGAVISRTHFYCTKASTGGAGAAAAAAAGNVFKDKLNMTYQQWHDGARPCGWALRGPYYAPPSAPAPACARAPCARPAATVRASGCIC